MLRSCSYAVTMTVLPGETLAWPVSFLTPASMVETCDTSGILNSQ